MAHAPLIQAPDNSGKGYLYLYCRKVFFEILVLRTYYFILLECQINQNSGQQEKIRKLDVQIRRAENKFSFCVAKLLRQNPICWG
jgi:hypothetical protein